MISPFDRVSTNDRRLFIKIIDVKEDYDNYRLVNKWGILNRYYSISKLNPLSNHIEIRILKPPPTNLVSLYHCAVKENIVEKIPIYYNCRDEKT